MQALFNQLYQQIENTLLVDRHRLRKQIDRFQQFYQQQRLSQPHLDKFLLQFQQSREQLTQRIAALPKPSYDSNLPVVTKREAIAQAISEHQVVVIAGETGSGKTTQIPKICLELGYGAAGLIGHTQPRRLAARTVATRIAEELAQPLGQAVGYKVRFTDQVSDNTYVKLMTDGILLAETQHDPYLNQYEVIIIDEAHERSLNIDFLLGYLKNLLPKRPDLKVIITSATIDPERFSQHFNNAPIIEVSGRTYPVDIVYRPLFEAEDADYGQADAIADAVDELCKAGPGDILVFLSGERDIRDTAEYLRKHHAAKYDVLPLYARLSNAEQNKVFQPHAGRRVVLATNVAETSITVPGIRYVVDTGFARISRYSYRSKIQRLPIEPISQASAQQRAGRCGRVADGICIRLYSEEDFQGRPEFTDPEIKRTNLASVILQMLFLRLGNIDKFPFVDKPDHRAITDGLRLLHELGGIDQKQRLTNMGRQLAQFPIEPRLARMILEGAKTGCLKETLVLASGLSVQDPRERPVEKQQAADEKHRRFQDQASDFVSLLNLWDYFKQQKADLSQNQLRKLCKKEYLSFLRLREWQEVYIQLKTIAQQQQLRLNQDAADYASLHRALLSGLLSHIGFYKEGRDYLGARNSKFQIFPGSGLYKKRPKFIVAAELVETSQLFARMVAKIELDWIEPLSQHLLKRSYSEPFWEKKAAQVSAHEQCTLYGLIIVPQRKVNYGPIEPEQSRELFIQHALVRGEINSHLKLFKHNQEQIKQIEKLEDKERRRDLLQTEAFLYEYFEQQLGDKIYSGPAFTKWYQKQPKAVQQAFYLTQELLLKESPDKQRHQQFPDRIQLGDVSYRLRYQFTPGEVQDGASLITPVAALKQLSDHCFDYCVPGLLLPKIEALIRTLPKPIRRNCVPVPEYAKACYDSLIETDFPSEPLVVVLTQLLRRMTGVHITVEDWRTEDIPAHLQLNFVVVDTQGKTLASQRDLTTLLQQFSQQMQQATQRVKQRAFERDGITTWDFGDLPAVFEKKQVGVLIKWYPCLRANTQDCSLQLLDSEIKAQRLSLQGIALLVQLQLSQEVKYLQKTIKQHKQLGLQFAKTGQFTQLIDDIIIAAIEQLVTEWSKNGLARNAEQFAQCVEYCQQHMVAHTTQIQQLVADSLKLAHQIGKEVAQPKNLGLMAAYSDISRQMKGLIYVGFVRDVGIEQLRHYARYLKGILLRMERIAVNPTKDKMMQQQVEGWLADWDALKGQVEQMDDPSELLQLRWMIEEYRISLFAQGLKTAYPISDKRLNKQLELLKSGFNN